MTLKITATLIVTVALALTVLLNYVKFERTFSHLVESRFAFIVRDLRVVIQTGLDLGLDLAAMANVQTIIEREAERGRRFQVPLGTPRARSPGPLRSRRRYAHRALEPGLRSLGGGAGTPRLLANERLFLHTDGVTDAVDSHGQPFAADQFEATLRGLAARPPDGMVRGVLDRLRAFADSASQFDDITVLALAYHGSPAR